jgi:hypothetical protein
MKYIYQHIGIKGIFKLTLILLVFTFVFISSVPRSEAATQTLEIYSHISDQSLQTSPYPGSWINQYYSTGGMYLSGGTIESSAFLGAFNSSQGYLSIHRSFLAFDTSVIPDNAEIVSVNLRIVPMLSWMDIMISIHIWQC